jgi:Ion channel
MPDLPSLLGKIPDEYKPIAAIGVGALMLVCIVLFHGTGLHHILLLHKRGERRVLAGKPRRWELVVLFTWVVSLMLSLHLLEIIIWALALDHLGLMPRVHDAIYFCANAYTTEGYGNVDLERHWRNIGPIIAISGLFTFAWTTSLLVDVVATHRRLLALLEEERERNQAARGMFFERYKIWKGKRREVKDLPTAEGERNHR